MFLIKGKIPFGETPAFASNAVVVVANKYKMVIFMFQRNGSQKK
jgi:hypothetical protein